MVKSERVPEKGRIRASIEKKSGWVPEKGQISVWIEKWENPGEYLEKVEFVLVSKNYPDECRKRIESVWVPENGRIWESTGER